MFPHGEHHGRAYAESRTQAQRKRTCVRGVCARGGGARRPTRMSFRGRGTSGLTPELPKDVHRVPHPSTAATMKDNLAAIGALAVAWRARAVLMCRAACASTAFSASPVRPRKWSVKAATPLTLHAIASVHAALLYEASRGRAFPMRDFARALLFLEWWRQGETLARSRVRGCTSPSKRGRVAATWTAVCRFASHTMSQRLPVHRQQHRANETTLQLATGTVSPRVLLQAQQQVVTCGARVPRCRAGLGPMPLIRST